MAYSREFLIPCGQIGDRLIWHYQNVGDTLAEMMCPRYFPNSLEADEIIPEKTGVHIIGKPEPERFFSPFALMGNITETLNGISSTIVAEGMSSPVASKGKFNDRRIKR